jgi:hypothetical protein
MVEDHKKNESNDESERRMRNIEDRLSDIASDLNEIMACLSARNDLGDRVKALEGEVEALQRGNNTGFKHENDGGWFD